MREFLETLKYDRPITYGLLVASCGLVVLISVFMALPPAPILKAIGVTGAQTTVGATVNALYWSGRVLFNRSGEEVPERVFGNLDGIDEQGRVIVTVMVGDRIEQRHYNVADTKIVDVYGAARMVQELRYADCRFDVYHENQAVIWIKGGPLNVRMIEAGVAKPDPNPPTNIVDSAFASYYWTVAKGKSKGEKL